MRILNKLLEKTSILLLFVVFIILNIFIKDFETKDHCNIFLSTLVLFFILFHLKAERENENN